MTENVRIRLVLSLVVLLVIVCASAVYYYTYRSFQDSGQRLKVSVLYRGGRGDAYNDMALTGAYRTVKAFRDRVAVREVKTLDYGNNQEFILRLQAQSEAYLIICVGYDYVDAVRAVAKEYPRTKYVVVDGYIPRLIPEDNITCIMFREREGAFLMGAAAALRSQTGIIGFLGGAHSTFIQIFENGYLAGARYIKPEITVLADYIGEDGRAFNDPEKAFQLSVSQYAAGADVIFHAAGASGLGLLDAAASQRRLMIGVDSDQSLTAHGEQRQYILTSMMKRVDNAVYNVIDRAVHGSLHGGYYEFGLKEGGIGYAENQYNSPLLQPIKSAIEEIRKKIIAGEIVLPARSK